MKEIECSTKKTKSSSIKVQENIKPELLKKGDTIGLISPSSIIQNEDDLKILTKSIETMEKMGLKVIKGKYAFANETGYGAKAKHKADDINEMFANKNIKAIFTTTGGENSLSTFEYLNFELIKNNPKILCGFSDTTSILNEITEKTGLITYLGPSMKSICSGETDYRLKAIIARLKKRKNNLFYDDDISEIKIIREGKAFGKLVGGNLTLTTDLTSGKYKIDFKNKILLMEDLAFEAIPEKVSHDLYKMKQEGIFEQISGIWIGNYEGEVPIEKILLDTIDDIEFDKPIIKSENFGHGEKKIVIPIGHEATIDTKNRKKPITLC